jgi:argininosuccinate lyase
LFDTVDTVKICLEVYTGMMPRITVHEKRMKQACEQGFLNATDFADYLVARGMPFRQAHAVAGRAVAFALKQGRELDQLSLSQLRSFSELIQEDIYEFISLEQMISRRISQGGTGFDNVAQAIDAAQKELGIS